MYWASLIPEENFSLFYNLVFLGVIILSSLIVSSLQLNLGSFLMLHHGSRGRHTSSKTDSLASSFICGSMVMQFLILGSGAIFYHLSRSITFLLNPLRPAAAGVYAICAGLLISLGLIAWCFYYRSHRTTELWLPPSVSRFLKKKCSNISTRIEAFSLGLLTVFFEFPFIIVPAFLTYYSLVSLPAYLVLLDVAIYLLFSILPPLICRHRLKKGENVATIQRWREKNHRFFRILTGILYFILAIFIIVFILLGELV